MRQGRLFCVALICAALLGLGLFSSAAADKGSVTLGMITPLTGTNAQAGQDMERGVRLALDRINEGYKIPLKDGSFQEIGPGLLGKPLKIIVENTESRPKSGMDATRKLVNMDKVPVILGEYASDVSIATGQFTNANRIVQIAIGAASPKMREVGPFTFDSLGLDTIMGKELAKFAMNDSGATSFGSITPNNPFGVGLELQACKALKELGGECVSRVRYKLKQSDYRAEVRAVFAPKPEAAFFTAYGTEARLILRQAHEMGKAPPNGWYADYITMWSNEVSKMPEIAEGIKGLQAGVAGDFYDNEYANPYRDQYGHSPKTAWGAYGFDAAMLAALAIQKTGSLDPDAIREALYPVSRQYKGVTGDKTFDQDGMQATESYVPKIYTNGQLKDYPLK